MERKLIVMESLNDFEMHIDSKTISDHLSYLGGVKKLSRLSHEFSKIYPVLYTKQDVINVRFVLRLVYKKLMPRLNLDNDEEIFEMGDSILVVKIIAELKSVLGIKVSLADVFDHATINSLTLYVLDNDDSGIVKNMAEFIVNKI
jgi:acyl carrier protein